MSKKIKLDQFHYHEALDRTHSVIGIVENMLIEHPVIDKHKKIRKKIIKAQEILGEVYQEIGGLTYQMFENSKNE